MTLEVVNKKNIEVEILHTRTYIYIIRPTCMMQYSINANAINIINNTI